MFLKNKLFLLFIFITIISTKIQGDINIAMSFIYLFRC